jgi:hypothetical protein
VNPVEPVRDPVTSRILTLDEGVGLAAVDAAAVLSG